jgi:hypothetical protein
MSAGHFGAGARPWQAVIQMPCAPGWQFETHLERIALQRPLEQIADLESREQARHLRDWFLSEFLQAQDE